MIKEIKEHSFYEEKLRPEITVIDLGACKGEFTDELNSLYKIKKAILVEANPTNFKQLVAKDNYILYNNLISEKDNEITDFLEDPNSPYNGSSIFNYFSGITHKIKSISLDTIINNNNIDIIDVLKIDIEGSEYEILETLSDKTYEKISQITVEFHDFIDPSFKDRTEKLIKKIQSFGFNSLSKSIDYMHGSEHYDVLFYR